MTKEKKTPRGGAVTPKSSGQTWTVKSGETLSGISFKALGTSKRWREIADLNPKYDPNRIPVGAVLTLPTGSTAPRQAPKNTPNKKKPAKDEPVLAAGQYVIKKGDMLSLIAQRELGSAARWREIQKLNPKINPDRLVVGTVLAMPEGKNASAGAVAVATPKRSSKRSRVR